MAWRTRVPLVLAFAAVLLLASGAVAAAGGLSARPEAMPSLHALRRVEDDASSFVLEGEEAAAYLRRRALYSGGSIDYGALTASKAACYGPCPARGQAYSRGCQAIYQCRG
ncbi:hypothetical protein GQ55_8G141300 [Panicum hallii var. hallii]|uniref:Rapid alkalinization factor 1 n=1 Tax=Panicum hallii var. hallii TaxID=1504633 RepID=A0A2T7CN34_9POAL|nr:hypothetical protein GQ55_8G141300 [Panicum hallii var. hallii]